MAKHAIIKDPAILRQERPVIERRERLALALDLGTTTGYAYAVVNPDAPIVLDDVDLHIGQWDLSAGQYDSGAIRFVKLRHFLKAISPDLVIYERVRNTPPVDSITRFNASALMARAATSAQLFGALMGTVSGWCEEYGVPCTGVEISAIKKRATGKGNASKEDVIRAMNAQFGTEFDPETYDQTGVDNICDAAFGLVIGLEELADGLGGADSIHSSVGAAGAAD